MAAKGTTQAFVRLRSKTTGAWLAHPDLRPRLVAEAAEKNTNLNDLILTILSAHFNVPHEPSTKSSSPKEDNDVLLFGLPPALARAVALSYPNHKMDGIRYVLCAYFGLRVPPKVKQTRRPRSAPAPA